ncbi:MAG TPA: 50S ribosomal protein L17 [Pseudomonadota bacterium]|jgi:large subunit ribosomal protein L17|nr:50S ribosomal protein L17 [Pseudomonadota bacterium]HNK47258.1 50S ribosomal protein L17 [Pseudomonadota bacterium]HNN50782.1 50S ribosomal protein L17 [Pseudomonadota bacterium]
MRHQKSGRTFGRKADHRKALWSNMVSSLIQAERIQTTDVKAKELRRFAEPAIAWAVSVGSLLSKDEAKRTAEEKTRIVHAMRMAQRIVKNREALHKLFDELGPRYASRHGGYLRIIKKGFRHGDAAPVSIVELVDRPEAGAQA